VGDGPLRQVIEQQFSGPDVTFLKHQAYAKTVQLTASSHVSVVPSLCEESCSTTTLEALSLGRPCFALRRGGTPELAVYQRWPGQLQLFDTIEDLVQGLLTHMQSQPSVLDVATTHGEPSQASDVMALLPNILQVYEA
jgi:glycosyltransferase involved in cell wall biosynthesis